MGGGPSSSFFQGWNQSSVFSVIVAALGSKEKRDVGVCSASGLLDEHHEDCPNVIQHTCLSSKTDKQPKLACLNWQRSRKTKISLPLIPEYLPPAWRSNRVSRAKFCVQSRHSCVYNQLVE